ncbi:MAG: diguanylate cyclase [Rhodocyclaceae bacterium]|nr:diguanylate cyclase [Rhodocyclaceae bacterium]
MQAEITIREILHVGLLACAADTPVAEAARRMVEARCSSIMIEDGGVIVGIWTERDALMLDLAVPEMLQSAVAQFMSAPVKTLPITTRIGEAAMRFRDEDIRHFLVTDDAGQPCGVISQSDIVINQGIEYFIALREVGAVFNRRYQIVAGSAPLSEAVAAMQVGHLDAVVVRRTDGVFGILTERDVVRLISVGRPQAPVGEIASYPLITLPLKASLYQARKLFVENRIRHLGVSGGDGELLGLITFADILANVEHEYVRHLREALRESEASLAASTRNLRLAAKAFESTFEGILVTNAERVIESVNPAFTQITGYLPEEVIGKTPGVLASGRHDRAFYAAMDEALAATGHWQGEICNRRKDGEVYVEWLTINAVRDTAGETTNYVAVFTDFTTRKAAEDHMRFLAQHDALTGLPNRNLLRERLLRAIPHAQRNGKKLAVIFLDLDGFKAVNDNFGHGAGDQMLRIVAQRLTDGVRGEDTVARLGGDEFILVLEELGGVDGIPGIVAKIVDAVAQPISFEGRKMNVATSVGISIYPDDGADPDELIKHADAAMYVAKEKGSNAFHFFAK